MPLRAVCATDKNAGGQPCPPAAYAQQYTPSFYSFMNASNAACNFANAFSAAPSSLARTE